MTRPNSTVIAPEVTANIKIGRALMSDNTDRLSEYLKTQASLLEINESDLDGEFRTQAYHFIKAASLHNKFAHHASLAKTKYETLLAEKAVNLRSQASHDKEKLTEKSLEERLTLDPEVRKAKEALLMANYHASQYQSVTRAWEHKKDCLIQVGSNVRAGISAPPQVNYK